MYAKLLEFGEDIALGILNGGTPVAVPGSGMHLLFGERPSTQSINIRFGRRFETWFHEAVQSGDNEFKMIKGGVQNVGNGIKKDIDLIFADETNKVIYYRELKLNMDLDSEKLPATYEKVTLISNRLKKFYPEYMVNSAVLTWSTYYKKDITKNQSKIKACEANGVAVEDPSSFFKIISLKISKDEYDSYFRRIGSIFNGVKQ